VPRALQVLVEPREPFERGIAQEALVRPPIPRTICCPHLRRDWWFIMTLRPGEQPPAVRDVVFLIGTDDETIKVLARHVRRAGARLEMVHECCVRNEGPAAAAAGAAHLGWLVYLGIQVMAEVTLVLEAPFAIGAVGVHVAIVALELQVTTEYLAALPTGVVVLVCMFPQVIHIIKIVPTLRAKAVISALVVVRLEARFRLEDPVVLWTIVVLVYHMLDPRPVEWKMAITYPTVRMIWALDVVLSALAPAVKVEIAVVTSPVRVGILHVLLEGSVISEPSQTAITIGHLMVVVQSQGHKRRLGTWT